MSTKTLELVEDGEKLVLQTTIADAIEVVPEDVQKLDDDKARAILYVENDIRVLQARLADLQAEKVETAKLASTAASLRPLPVGKDVGGGGALKAG
jgi:hypothetical protein